MITLAGDTLLYGAMRINKKNKIFAREKVVMKIPRYEDGMTGSVNIETEDYSYSVSGISVDGYITFDLTDIMRVCVGDSVAASGVEVRLEWSIFVEEEGEYIAVDAEASLFILNGVEPYIWTLMQCNTIGKDYVYPPLKICYYSPRRVTNGTPTFGVNLPSPIETSGGITIDDSVATITDNFGIGDLVGFAEEVSDPREVAIVRYTNKLGTQNIAYFKPRKHKISVADTREIETLTNGFYQQKGEEIECELYIDGVDAYTYSYYADILTSPKVEVSMYLYTVKKLPAPQYEWLFVPCEVTTKNLTLPDGNDGKLHEFAFTIKYYQHDTI